MARKFRLSQFVRSFFGIQGLPSCLQQLTELYQKTFSSDVLSFFELSKKNDSLPHNLSLQLVEEEPTWDNKDLSRLSSVTYLLLKQWLYVEEGRSLGSDLSPLAFSRHHVVRLGQKFSTYGASANNSHVLFHLHPVVSRSALSPLQHGHLQAGNIQEIFSHTRTVTDGKSKTETFVVITPFKNLSGRLKIYDPYREFPLVANRLFEVEEGKGILISMEQVMSHFVHVPITLKNNKGDGLPVKCVVAYPLDV